jgi:hypothetical protein
VLWRVTRAVSRSYRCYAYAVGGLRFTRDAAVAAVLGEMGQQAAPLRNPDFGAKRMKSEPNCPEFARKRLRRLRNESGLAFLRANPLI